MIDNHLLDALTRQGVLISVSCRYWRAAKKLQAADLGLDPDDVADRLISLGHKRLLPKDALAAFALIESRAHSLVESSTNSGDREERRLRELFRVYRLDRSRATSSTQCRQSRLEIQE